VPIVANTVSFAAYTPIIVVALLDHHLDPRSSTSQTMVVPLALAYAHHLGEAVVTWWQSEEEALVAIIVAREYEARQAELSIRHVKQEIIDLDDLECSRHHHPPHPQAI
jgi:hypothetical protein